MIELIRLTDVDNDEAEAIYRVSAKAKVEIKIENGEWVSDEPVGYWYEPKSAYGKYSDIWKTDSDDDVPNAYLMDGQDFYEVVCEDLINVPEIEKLPDGAYYIECDASVDILIEHINVIYHIGYDWDSHDKESYHVGYNEYDTSNANNIIIGVDNKNIKISEADKIQ